MEAVLHRGLPAFSVAQLLRDVATAQATEPAAGSKDVAGMTHFSPPLFLRPLSGGGFAFHMLRFAAGEEDELTAAACAAGRTAGECAAEVASTAPIASIARRVWLPDILMATAVLSKRQLSQLQPYAHASDGTLALTYACDYPGCSATVKADVPLDRAAELVFLLFGDRHSAPCRARSLEDAMEGFVYPAFLEGELHELIESHTLRFARGSLAAEAQLLLTAHLRPLNKAVLRFVTEGIPLPHGTRFDEAAPLVRAQGGRRTFESEPLEPLSVRPPDACMCGLTIEGAGWIQCCHVGTCCSTAGGWMHMECVGLFEVPEVYECHACSRSARVAGGDDSSPPLRHLDISPQLRQQTATPSLLLRSRLAQHLQLRVLMPPLAVSAAGSAASSLHTSAVAAASAPAPAAAFYEECSAAAHCDDHGRASSDASAAVDAGAGPARGSARAERMSPMASCRPWRR